MARKRTAMGREFDTSKFVKDRNESQSELLTAVNKMLDEGFRNVDVSFQQIADDGHYFHRVIINEREISTIRMEELIDLCESNGWEMALVHEQGEFSRIGVWLG
jgi:hypothetical protein